VRVANFSSASRRTVSAHSTQSRQVATNRNGSQRADRRRRGSHMLDSVSGGALRSTPPRRNGSQRVTAGRQVPGRCGPQTPESAGRRSDLAYSAQRNQTLKRDFCRPSLALSQSRPRCGQQSAAAKFHLVVVLALSCPPRAWRIATTLGRANT
jgi:hypothetical protein